MRLVRPFAFPHFPENCQGMFNQFASHILKVSSVLPAQITSSSIKINVFLKIRFACYLLLLSPATCRLLFRAFNFIQSASSKSISALAHFISVRILEE